MYPFRYTQKYIGNITNIILSCKVNCNDVRNLKKLKIPIIYSNSNGYQDEIVRKELLYFTDNQRQPIYTIYNIMEERNIQPIQSVLYVDDNIDGISSALNSGCWVVYLNKENKKKLCCAHYIIDSVIELNHVKRHIDMSMKVGVLP